MASVGISIPPSESVTSPVSAKKSAFNDAGNRGYETFSRRHSAHGGQSERATAGQQRVPRKRSFSVYADCRGGKRRRYGIVPPTKFLLGGNICDPLNLGSLNDEEANRIANANTPVSSPMPTPKYRKERIEVIIPPDISDPLGLNGPEDSGGPDSLVSPSSQRKKKNKRKKKHPSGHGADRSASEPAGRSLSESGARSVSESGDSSTVAPSELEFTPCTDAGAPCVSAPPEVPPSDGPTQLPQHTPVFRARDAAFQYGNYNRYYGYRNPDQLDSRLGWLKREWFSGLDVLDVGCNVGHVTLTVARDYLPRRCVGVDIDSGLVKVARRNVKHYQRAGEFPDSMPLLYGDLQPPHKAPGTQFPRNVTFEHANFVLETDAMLETVRPEFDTILCLSITKWVHLNFGDAGMRRFFRRVFLSLRPGGRLLLEPQPWASYVKKKKLTPRIWQTFHEIRLRPETFPDLLINEIGFECYKTVGRPHHSAKGFSRQLQLFTKAGEVTAVPPSSPDPGAPASSAPPADAMDGGEGAPPAGTPDGDGRPGGP
ncbi:probable RNA methyltransferase Y17G7B.18 [Pollicipes pollicipes]|uniref:probable RNA methyltransferase Y17G7B.18 n=1 Tax=Pollicipes pollicipes TaxID=41117 RepID=UPI0018859435|nr:probable RNA methyltransferase Y17G7B.18 [Pollicipes pollicipes]